MLVNAFSNDTTPSRVNTAEEFSPNVFEWYGATL